MKMDAEISPCGKYRYWLSREWDAALSALPFVMLNPSTADASTDDPTIRRCIGFARREGCGGIIVANVFACRAISPRALADTPAPMGAKNYETLVRIAQTAQTPIVCAWGAHAGSAGGYTAGVLRDHGARLVCLGKTNGGAPRHPLYVKAGQALEPFH